MVFWNVKVPESLKTPPPVPKPSKLESARLSVIVLLNAFTVPKFGRCHPHHHSALLPLTVLLTSVKVPLFEMPPPLSSTWLSLTVLLRSVKVPCRLRCRRRSGRTLPFTVLLMSVKVPKCCRCRRHQ